MNRKALVMAVAVLLLAGAALAIWRPWASRAPQQAAAPGQGAQARATTIPVETAVARATKVTSDIQAIGSLQSDESINVAPEIAARIASFNFEEGREVKQGDVIISFDDSLVAAEVDQAEARFNLAKSNLDRATRLASSGAGTTQGRDEATAEFETTQSSLELANVRRSKHKIIAPFSGVMGIRNVSPGAFVAIGTTIVNLEKIDTLKVDFKVPEIYLEAVTAGQEIEVTLDALPGRTFMGKITAIDPMIDVNGRALTVRAILPNPERLLRPGLFARIVVRGRTEKTAVLIPESALVPRGAENFVYRVDDGKAVEVKVTIGERKAGDVAVIDGIAADAIIVTAGQQRLRNGAAVEAVVAPNRARS